MFQVGRYRWDCEVGGLSLTLPVSWNVIIGNSSIAFQSGHGIIK